MQQYGPGGGGEYGHGDPRNPFGKVGAPGKGAPGKGAPGYEAMVKFLKLHPNLGTEDGSAPPPDAPWAGGGPSVEGRDGDPEWTPYGKTPWGYLKHNTPEGSGNAPRLAPGGGTPINYVPRGKPQTDGGQQAMLTSPLGLNNWQMTQKTDFNLHNRTGSDVFIAASTMAG